MISQSVSSLSSATSTGATYTTSSSNDTMTKTDFLTLLVTQLKNQDPTNPQDSSEFASQLAQYSSLEQLMNLNDSVTTLQTSTNASAANALIGKDVLYDGNTLSLTSGTTPGDLNLALGGDAAKTTIKIYNSNGKVVRTIDAGALNGGTQSVAWDGLDDKGNALASGDYTFTVTAADSSGTTVSSATLIREQVTGVMLSNGTYYLSTESGTLLTQAALYAVEDHVA